MQRFKNHLAVTEKRCNEYFESYPMNDIMPIELKVAATDYFKRGGKRLRPALMSLCAAALGGKKADDAILPAMVSAELFHTFTLVHDDIIDNDMTRRGKKSIHILVRDMFAPNEKAEEYGKDVAILAGDTLHALAVRMLLECQGFKADTLIGVLKLLEGECINGLLAGETDDTRMGLMKSEIFDVGCTEESIEVMRKKTGVLLAYCAKAGAMFGLDTPCCTLPEVVSLGRFAELCGIAFQLRDDILGIISDEKTLGKPIGSDIREGKKTLILQEAYKNSNESERSLISATVGNKSASCDDIEKVKRIFLERGGLDFAERKAEEYINQAMSCLDVLPSSESRDMLELSAQFMSARKL